MEINTKIEQYVQLLDQINDRVGDETTAGRILQEIAQDQRAAAMQAFGNGTGKHSKANETGPATERQLNWLKDLKANVPKGLTSQDASAMITELTGRA